AVELDDPDRLLEPVDPRPRSLQRDPQLAIVAGVPARPEPELEAPAGDRLHGHRLLGEEDRGAVVVAGDGEAEGDPLAPGRGGGEGGQRPHHREVIAEADRVEAHRLEPGHGRPPGGGGVGEQARGPDPEAKRSCGTFRVSWRNPRRLRTHASPRSPRVVASSIANVPSSGAPTKATP